jgi:heme/copper-type cytochrome/quinol oxidase subunit 2
MMRRTLPLIVVLVALLVPQVASACPVCFGDPNSAMTKGTSSGILFMLGIVGAVQLGFVALFYSFWRRARELRRRRESFRVLEGGAR